MSPNNFGNRVACMDNLSLNFNHQYTLSGISTQIWVTQAGIIRISEKTTRHDILLAQAAPMQKFEYRTPRYQVDFPVLLALESTSIHGRCREISREGMRVELHEAVTPEACGTVSFSYKELSLEVPVCVARSGAGQGGLRFVFESEKDRGPVDRLVALLAGATGQPGPTLVR
jgi:hypothetical protein